MQHGGPEDLARLLENPIEAAERERAEVERVALEALASSPAASLEEVEAAKAAAFDPSEREKILRRAARKAKAVDSIEGLAQDRDVFAFTCGEFSLVELLDALLDLTGPAALTLSTWTAAHEHLEHVERFIRSGRVTSFRMLVDFSFQRRRPGVLEAVRDSFGQNAVRVTRNHAKFALLDARDAGWNLVLFSSMNLSGNPRLEHFYAMNDARVFDFVDAFVSDLWQRTPAESRWVSKSAAVKQIGGEV